MFFFLLLRDFGFKGYFLPLMTLVFPKGRRMAAPYPLARRLEAGCGAGAGVDEASARRRLSRGTSGVAVAVVAVAVSLCCYAALVAGPGAAPRTEAISVDAQGGGKGVSRDAERLIQRAVRKAVRVR